VKNLNSYNLGHSKYPYKEQAFSQSWTHQVVWVGIEKGVIELIDIHGQSIPGSEARHPPDDRVSAPI